MWFAYFRMFPHTLTSHFQRRPIGRLYRLYTRRVRRRGAPHWVLMGSGDRQEVAKWTIVQQQLHVQLLCSTDDDQHPLIMPLDEDRVHSLPSVVAKLPISPSTPWV